MSWKESFKKGIASFEANQLDKALEHFNTALANGGDTQFTIYDSRAAVYEKLGKHKEALLGAKKTIDTAPERWQGYARAGRLFLKAQKPDSSITMLDMAIARTKPDDAKRRVELENLRSQARAVQIALEKRQRSLQNHVSKLPVELLVEVFRIRVVEDLKSLISVIHVSKHWRDVAFGAPELWDTLVLSDRNPKKKVKFWVERSKGRIRELCVKAVACSYGVKDWVERLKFINWDRLRICRIQSWDIFQYLNSIHQTSVLDNLEELEVDDDGFHTRLNTLNRTDLIEASSKIQRICLRSAIFKWEILGCFSESLRYLEIYNPEVNSDNQSIPDLISIFRHNRNLETAIIDFSRSPWRFFHFEAQINVDLLRLTRLELHTVIVSSDFFQKIMTPNLQVLKLTRAVIHFPAITFSHLSELVLHKCQFPTKETLVNLLRGSPSLRILDLSLIAGAGALALELLTQPESELLCPLLTHLNVSGCPNVQTGPLVRLIKARLPISNTETSQTDDAEPRVSKIISLNVDGCAGVDSEWIPWFRKNLEFFSCVYMSSKAAKYKR